MAQSTTDTDDDRQLSQLLTELIFHILQPLLRVPSFLELEIQTLNDMADHHPHLKHCQILPDAVRWPEREGNERVRVVDDLLVRLLNPLSDKPPVRPEFVRVAEVLRVAMNRVEVDTRLGALRDEAEVEVNVRL